jgi:TonB family protein
MATTGTLVFRTAAAVGLALVFMTTGGCGGPSKTASGDAEDVQAMDAKPQWTQADIEAGVNAIGPSLIACYQKAVLANRSEAGSVIISASIAPDGHVESATPVRSSLSKDLASCLANVVLAARFRAPGVTGVRLSIPLAFEQSKDTSTQ